MTAQQLIRLTAPKRKGADLPYNAPTVCGLTTLSKPTIYRLIQSGRFPKPLLVGSRSLWRESDIIDWMNAQKQGIRDGLSTEDAQGGAE